MTWRHFATAVVLAIMGQLELAVRDHSDYPCGAEAAVKLQPLI